MVPSLPLLSCESSVSVKENPDKKNHEHMVVSLPKLQATVFLMKNIKSFMEKLNKIGPNIDPCVTFLRISRYELKVAPTFTR